MLDVTTSLFFFFFQAKDGIRYGTVTGVQTCALPIFPPQWSDGRRHAIHMERRHGHAQRNALQLRSEERRVGKGGRAGWSLLYWKKKVINVVVGVELPSGCWCGR